MRVFVRAVFEAGQRTPVNSRIDMKDLTPSATSLTKSLKEKAAEMRKDVRDLVIMKAVKVGGGITSDGLKQKLQGKKYYDLVLHFFSFDKNVLTGQTSVKMVSQVLLLEEHAGKDDAKSIRNALDHALDEKF